MEPCFCYITAGGMEEAERLGASILEARLAACVNLLPGMVSLYRWQGEIARGTEVVLIAKTRRDLVDDLDRLLRREHSYDTPCLVVLPIQGGHAPFLDWIRDETAPKG